MRITNRTDQIIIAGFFTKVGPLTRRHRVFHIDPGECKNVHGRRLRKSEVKLPSGIGGDGKTVLYMDIEAEVIVHCGDSEPEECLFGVSDGRRVVLRQGNRLVEILLAADPEFPEKEDDIETYEIEEA